MPEPTRSPGSIASALEPRSERVLRRLAGTVLARPWFDRAGLRALKHWFFPASRLWAAARASNGEIEQFWAEVPMAPGPADRQRLVHALRRFEEARAAVNAIEAEWHRVFFGGREEPESYRVGVEDARRELRHTYNATRRHFRSLIRPDVPRVKLTIDTPATAAAAYGATLGAPQRLFAPPSAQPEIEVSRRIAVPTGSDYWLRFSSPSARLGDTVWARVHEPPGSTDPPTVIYGHGICVEFDHWRGLIDECHAMVRLGFRVIRPEAPWHGRRVVPGAFGGERIIGTFPTGILDALTGAVQEWAVLARWARETSKGPLVLAGSSLGALTSQLTADCARAWAPELQPKAMLLVTHTGDITAAISGGALANLWASPAEVEAKGWTLDLARRYLAILDPGPHLAMPPQHIVSVLGRRDVILPYDGGRDLTERWCLPTANSFVLDRGHFSVPMALVRNPAPLRRLAEIVGGI